MTLEYNLRYYLFLSIVFLASCSTLNQATCGAMDWQELGYATGLEGSPASSIDRYEKSCSKYNVAVEYSAYEAGYTQGLVEYCTPKQIYLQSQRYLPRYNTKNYTKVCPTEHLSDLDYAYSLGREYFRTKNKLDEYSYALSEQNTREDEIYHEQKANKKFAKESDYREQMSELAEASNRELEYELYDIAARKNELKDQIEITTSYLELLQANHYRLLGLSENTEE